VSYVYRGDRWTAPERKGATCDAVRRSDGKCIRGRNGSMLVRFHDGQVAVVIGRQLRRLDRNSVPSSPPSRLST
jgi:hypothetical protein